jgi:DNA-binding SARP family transcriptional activator/ABC-type glycerol-3-phosphate transport system substrate-binding protein
MRFRVLGPIEVSGDDGPIPLGGPKQRSVLAHLIVRANHVVPTDTLIDQVWGDEPPAAARTSLQAYVSNLRKAIGADRLEGRSPGYVLQLQPDELDASRFEALLREARGADGDADRVATILREALALWRGPAFSDLGAQEALSGEIARLEELRLQALEERLAADLAAGRHGDVIGELESLTHEHPLRERLWAGLMLALYRSGRQADALAAFQRARRILSEELGVDPSPELQRLQERILRQDPELEVKGEPLRGYRLLDQIGHGAYGVVYRAVQPQVGREVAVKSIHPELANEPEFVRRFEREAQLVAQLEHPHVVPLYDYWREPGGAYLVMRLLRGGTLEDLLTTGGLPLERVAALLDDVASALSAAHRQGVVHRDVKPGNVLLDEDGNAYLSDFGVAIGEGSVERASGRWAQGTPAYLSPEQIRHEPATPRSDIYSLGVVLFEMLTGRHPFPERSRSALLDLHLEQPLPSVKGDRSDLPATVDAVIARATAKQPAARYPHAQELATAFRSAIAAPAGGPPRSAEEVRNPYKGLRAFLEADAGDFFGRETLIRRLTERLAQPGPRSRFLCVVGPSGSGKSSMVRAGLVPALRRGAVEGSDRWFVVEVMPGAHPLRELESALLGIAVTPPPSLLQELERDEFGLARAAALVLPDGEAELLIVLDQLEELFTLVDDDAERAHVLESIRAAVEAPGSRVRIVATLRADFFDQPLSVRGFGELLAERAEAITPMTPEQLERAIAGPAEGVGLEVEPGLIASMVADVADRSGGLPLLQYALTELAEQEGDTLTVDGYHRIGGVAGALARRAEALFQPMNETARRACRRLFLRLVAIGEGTEGTRRRVRRAELRSLGDAPVMESVIETFGRHRLLSFDRKPDSREPTVEIAHEALLAEWDRLRDWIDASRDDLRVHARISASTIEWMQADRSQDYLLAGAWLAQAEEAVARPDSLPLSGAERGYVDASLARRDEETAAARASHEREIGLERRARSRLRGLVAVLAVASVLAASLTVVSVSRSRDAERQRDESTISGLTGASLSSLNTDPELSVLLALHAIGLSDATDRPVPAETVEALHWAMQEAGTEYPVDEGPPTIAAGPLGVRGIFDVPLPELAEAARADVTRSLTPAECERFLGTPACPSLPSAFPADLRSEPVDAIPAIPEQPLFGTQVTFFGGNDPIEVAALRTAEFNDLTDRTGIEVRLVGNPTFQDYVAESLEAGDPPDIAVVPQPGVVRDFARDGHLIDLGTYVDIDRLRRDQSPYLVSLGTVADDGSWPSSDGATYGAFVQLNLKSMIWYPEPELRAEGYPIPATWDELIALSDRLVRDGRTPWCLGWESGGASGWPGTDWIEHLLLMDAGPDLYDAWTFHRIPFDSASVRGAFERLGRILFTDGYVADGAVLGSWAGAQLPMVRSDPPGCWLHQFPTFATHAVSEDSAGVTTDAFAFPTSGGRSRAVMGAGNMMVVFSDRPEVRAVVKYMLGPNYGTALVESTSFISANRRFDVANYEPFERRQAGLINAALADDAFRFDASDLMPPPVGNGLFWDAMMTYATEGPQSLDRILAELDAAWPDDT